MAPADRRRGRAAHREDTMKRALPLLALLLVPALCWGQRTSVSGDLPVYSNGGLPDLTIDPKRFNSQMEIVDRLFEAGACELEEGTIGGTGYRRLLRFDTAVMNMGDGDLVVGNPADPSNPYASWFIFATCHHHYHIRDFSNYQLLNLDRTVAASGHKQAFCLEDLLKYETVKSNKFSCANQGITSGWADLYFKQLSGQWIDITGLPEGDYIVRCEINAAHTFNEGQNRYPDVLEAAIHVPNPRNKVTVDTAPLDYGH
jgi:hypothetical protein